MKMLAVIIAFILFSGSLDFCQESGDCEGKAKVEVCSPLCHCSGCVFSIVIPKVTQQPPVTVVILGEFELPPVFSVPTVSYSIWQPPRLAAV
jgi:hypothetical protein